MRVRIGGGAGGEARLLHLKRQHQNELLSDTPQKRGESGACGATITKKSDLSIPVLLYINIIYYIDTDI